MDIQTLMGTTQFWIFAVVAVIALWMTWKASKVSGKTIANVNKTFVVIVFLAVGVGALYLSNLGSFIGVASPLAAAIGVGAGAGTGIITPIQATQCPPGSVEDASVTFKGIDAYTLAASGGTHRVSRNGGPASAVSDGGTLTVSGGDTLDILWMNGTATGNYFSDKSSVTLSCSNGAPEVSQKLYRNGTVTLEVFNTNGNLISTSENQTMAAGDVKTLTMKVKGSYQRGQPYGGIIVAEWNNTVIDDVIVEMGGVPITVPQVDVPTYATSSGRKAYTVPAILGTAILEGQITLDADDSNAPATVNTTNILLTYYSNNYFVSSTGVISGPAAETDQNVQTFGNRVRFNVYT